MFEDYYAWICPWKINTIVYNYFLIYYADYAALFATLIARCAKDIDTLIDSLPSEESSQELQVASLSRLEQENQEAAEQLEEVVRQGEALLERIQAALQDIAQSQLDMQNPTANTVINPSQPLSTSSITTSVCIKQESQSSVNAKNQIPDASSNSMWNYEISLEVFCTGTEKVLRET